jgi:hypothetical protein
MLVLCLRARPVGNPSATLAEYHATVGECFDFLSQLTANRRVFAGADLGWRLGLGLINVCAAICRLRKTTGLAMLEQFLELFRWATKNNRAHLIHGSAKHFVGDYLRYKFPDSLLA